MPTGPTADQSEQTQKDSVAFDTFSGLRNTVSPERLSPRELARAQNVDCDDAGELHRRRGFRKAIIGRCHSLFTTQRGVVLCVKDDTLVQINPDFSTNTILAGIGPARMSMVDIDDHVYACSTFNSCKVRLPSLTVAPWGRLTDHSYQPGLEPAPADWWYSPIVNPEPTAGLGPVNGRLLGPPPLGQFLAAFNGRIYIAFGKQLWVTELFLFDWVDRNKGYRQFEDQITGLCAVEDGVYVGTTTNLYFLQGSYGEEKRVIRENSGVVPGTMITVPGEILTPEGRRRPDIPQQTSKGMACMTNDGQVVGLANGTTYNLTRTNFIFPRSVSGAAMFRKQDGIEQVVTTLDSGGTPTDSARIGDYCDATVIYAASSMPPPSSGAPATVVLPNADEVIIEGLDGSVLFKGIPE